MLLKFKTSHLATVVFTATVVLSSTTSFANKAQCKQDYEKIISKEITKMGTAFNDGNYQYIADKSDSSIIELTGGKANYDAILLQAVTAFKNENIKVDKVDTQPPKESHIIQNKEFCVIPKHTSISINGKTVAGDMSFMLAVRPLDSNEWKYIDGAGLKKNPDMLQILFPEIPPNKIILPK